MLNHYKPQPHMKLKSGLNSVPSKVLPLLASIALLVSGFMLPVQAGSPHLAMGNPSQAVADTAQKNNFLMEKEFFAISYNDSKGTPNWVSWHLTSAELGKAPRLPFHPDTTLPVGFTQITPKDYTGGGFDRGHMCPHSDRSADNQMSDATFVMSNMIPQAWNVNEQAWAQLESYCRSLVEQEGKTLYIISGPAGKGGVGRKGKASVIGTTHKVTVPAQCWKVIMVLDAGQGDDVSKVNANTRLIAVIMPNNASVGEDWRGFRCSVQDVEKLTGYKFFDTVPADIIEPLKEEVDQEPVSAPGHLHT